MPRKRSIELSAVNVTMHPHQPDWYADLFELIHERSIPTKVRGYDWGIIGTCSRDDEIGVVTGTMWRFINLDPTEPWVDLNAHRELDTEGKAPIIPDHLKPHLRRFSYVFFPDGHRLFFNAREVSPGTVAKLMNGLCADPVVARKYGDISISIECDKQSIEAILKLQRRAMIDIFFSMPNADDLSRLKKRVVARMNKQNAVSLNETWKAKRGGDIVPDDATKSLMDLALSNGHVKAVGYTENDERVETDSTSHPVRKAIKYNPVDEDFWDVLIQEGRKLLQHFKRRG